MAPDAALWDGSELTLATPVAVEGAALATAEGSVVVRGSWETVVVHECGRCLEDARMPVQRAFTLAYVPDERRPGGAAAWTDADERVLDGRSGVLNLDDAVREEVLLAVPRYLVPGEDGDGRCTRCGVPAARFRQPPKPPEPAVADPRWAALRALQAE